MKKGFTILELLVASLLLGMLVTILTMIFNQSSIAWRTGVASVADLDDVRENIATVREEADNLYVWRNNALLLESLWDESGNLRQRAITENSSEIESALKSISGTTTQRNLPNAQVGSATAGSGQKTYIVNIKSAGPDREFETWDDIWSYPDDFE